MVHDAQKAQSRADQVLREFAIQTPPIEVETLARLAGAHIARIPFEGSQSGFALREGHGKSKWIIGVNSANSRRRQRFTIAHELGHLLMHEGRELTVDHSLRVNFRDHISSLATDGQEIEANAFAAALLMPRGMILAATQDAMRGPAVTREALIGHLSKKFDVSTEAMGFRLVNLGILSPA